MQTVYMRICNCTLSWLLNSVEEVEIVLILMCIILGVIWLCAAMPFWITIIAEVHCLSKIGQCIRAQGASKRYQHKGIGTAGIGDIYLYLL